MSFVRRMTVASIRASSMRVRSVALVMLEKELKRKSRAEVGDKKMGWRRRRRGKKREKGLIRTDSGDRRLC